MSQENNRCCSQTLRAKNMTAIESRFPPLALSDDPLHDVIRFVQEENVVVLFTNEATRIFYTQPFSHTTGVPFSDRRVIYIDCEEVPYGLGQDAWDRCIAARVKDVKELSTGLFREMILEQRWIQNKIFIALGKGSLEELWQ
jgi:hypothetical protein